MKILKLSTILAFFIFLTILAVGCTSQLNVEVDRNNMDSEAETPIVIIEPEPIMLAGSGQQASQKFTLEKGLSIFRMKHEGSSNFGIWLLDEEGNKIELLVNDIGIFNGAKAVGIVKEKTYLLDISASGKWDITIEQPRPTQAQSIPITLNGTNQQVSDFFTLSKGLTIFKLTHKGQSNFGIWLLDNNGQNVELLVNEIGEFDGSKAVRVPKDDIYLLDITASGEWSIAVE